MSAADTPRETIPAKTAEKALPKVVIPSCNRNFSARCKPGKCRAEPCGEFRRHINTDIARYSVVVKKLFICRTVAKILLKTAPVFSFLFPGHTDTGIICAFSPTLADEPIIHPSNSEAPLPILAFLHTTAPVSLAPSPTDASLPTKLLLIRAPPVPTLRFYNGVRSYYGTGAYNRARSDINRRDNLASVKGIFIFRCGCRFGCSYCFIPFSDFVFFLLAVFIFSPVFFSVFILFFAFFSVIVYDFHFAGFWDPITVAFCFS